MKGSGWIAVAVALAIAGGGWAQPPKDAPAPDTSSPGPDSSGSDAAAQEGETGATSISGNPGTTNITTGTGALGRFLGFDKDSGIYLGGAWIGNGSWQMSGGRDPGIWTYNSLTLVDLSLDAEKLWGIKGGTLGVEFLQFAGQRTNEAAGVVQGYNGLEGPPPLVRQELYELWWRQSLFDEKLVIRIGKSVPVFDFNNVCRPVQATDVSGSIPSVTGLIYTPIFKNPTLITKMPGYYNSATGITATWAPTKNFYFSYGGFDGSQALGEQTGLQGPQFNGHYFHIWEAGFTWRLGPEKKPGKFGCGLWDQTGALTAVNGATVHGADGFYLFGSQRLWYHRPGVDNSGISGFYQFGFNNSNTMLERQYFGAGLTAFGLVPGRPKDSQGIGLAWSWLNTDPNAGAFFFPDAPGPSTSLRTNEAIVQAYYQTFVRPGMFFQPVVTYIPNPGERPGLPAAWALTFQVTILY